MYQSGAAFYLDDTEIQYALAAVINAAPNGLKSLATLPIETLEKLIAYPGQKAVIHPAKFVIPLANVNTSGYTVYDKTFTKIYTVTKDVDHNPTDDLTVPHLRPMTFGYHAFDIIWLPQLKHGDLFYIGYDSDTLIPSMHLVLMLYPAVTGGV